MAEYTYEKTPGYFKGPLLMEEILAAFPELTEGEGDERRCFLFLESSPDGSHVTLTVPDEITQAGIDAIVEAHDSSQPSIAEQIEQKRQAATSQVDAADVRQLIQDAEAATTIAALKAQVVALARLVGDLAVAQGHTPAVE
jgi:hypothetical protein